MIEAEARAALAEMFAVPRETFEKLEAFVAHLRAEAAEQNLIAASTLEHVWSRHILDSAQLVPLANRGSWVDLGSGAGFPGLIAATLRLERTTLIEARRKRAVFLQNSADLLDIASRTMIVSARAENIDPTPSYATISARAFAPLSALFAIGARFAGPATRWILPKGRSAQAELDTARLTWQGDFRIHPSITDPDSAIIIAERVRPRK